MLNDTKKQNLIESEKLYSVREATNLIPGIVCSPTLQKLIDNDVKNNNNKIFNAKILKRKKQRRYFIKGEDLLRIVQNKTFEKNETNRSGTQIQDNIR
jgi:hypothetical protein